MNPLDGLVIRLGVYIGQLEAQVQELHRQLVEKTTELEALKPVEDTVVRYNSKTAPQ